MFIKYSDIKIDKILEEDKITKTLKEVKKENCEDESVEGEGEEQSAENSDD